MCLYRSLLSSACSNMQSIIFINNVRLALLAFVGPWFTYFSVFSILLGWNIEVTVLTKFCFHLTFLFMLIDLIFFKSHVTILTLLNSVTFLDVFFFEIFIIWFIADSTFNNVSSAIAEMSACFGWRNVFSTVIASLSFLHWKDVLQVFIFYWKISKKIWDQAKYNQIESFGKDLVDFERLPFKFQYKRNWQYHFLNIYSLCTTLFRATPITIKGRFSPLQKATTSSGLNRRSPSTGLKIQKFRNGI